MTLEELLLELNQHPEISITISGVPGSTAPGAKKLSFEEWAWEWARSYKAGKVKDNTYFDSIERQLRLHLVPHFGPRPLAEILPVEVQEYFASLSDIYTLETQHKIKACLHSLFDAAIENGLCRRNPVTKSLKLRSSVPPAQKRIWTPEEYEIARKFALAHPKGLSVLVLMETAITRSELLGLEFNNFDETNNVLQIRNGLVPAKRLKTGKVECVHDGLKNSYRRRDIPISSELAARLRVIPREIVVDGELVTPSFLFYSPSGKAWNPSNWFHRCYNPFMHDFHTAYPHIEPLSPHELRHTRASILQMQGVDLYDIQRLMGHRDLTMLSRRYLHTNTEQLRKSLKL